VENNLENVWEVVAEFEKRISTEIRKQEKLDLMEKWDFRKKNVKNEGSGLNIFIFFSHFYFLFNLFSFILFLELGLEWQDYAVTQQVTSDDMVTSHMIHKKT